MLSAFYHLQQSSLCLSQTPQIWQPEVFRQGTLALSSENFLLFPFSCKISALCQRYWHEMVSALREQALRDSTVSSFLAYVRSLSYVTQARNIAVCVEFRESDEVDAQALKVQGCPNNFLMTDIQKILKVFSWPCSSLPLFCPSLHCPVEIKLKGQITLPCLCVPVMYSVSMVVQEVLSSPNMPMQLYCTTSKTQSFMMRWWMGCNIYFIGGQAWSNIPYRQTGV